MAGGSNDAFFHSPRLLAAELGKLLDGGEPRALVNRAVLPAVRERLGGAP